MLKHNERFCRAVLLHKGKTVCLVYDAIHWIDDAGHHIARYGDNIPVFTFHDDARVHQAYGKLFVHLDKEE